MLPSTTGLQTVQRVRFILDWRRRTRYDRGDPQRRVGSTHPRLECQKRWNDRLSAASLGAHFMAYRLDRFFFGRKRGMEDLPSTPSRLRKVRLPECGGGCVGVWSGVVNMAGGAAGDERGPISFPW